MAKIDLLQRWRQTQRRTKSQTRRTGKSVNQEGKPQKRGQALVEYVLILTLVVLAIITVLTFVGPVVGNIFSNTVDNLLNQTQTPYQTLSSHAFWDYVTAVASYTPPVIGVTITYSPVGYQTPTQTPIPTLMGGGSTTPFTKTYTPQPSPTPISDIQGPTPVDQVFPIPFRDDGSNSGNWSNNPYETPVGPATAAAMDIGTCAWGQDPYFYHSPLFSYADSPRNPGIANYAVGSDCYYKLRGSINLTGATKPAITFWDSYNLGAGATGEVCVRLQNSGTAYNCQIVRGPSAQATNYNWKYVTLDLTAFGAPSTNYVGKTIDVLYRLHATAAVTANDGWYVDDIFVGDNTTLTDNLPFKDGVTAPDSNWINECYWGVTKQNGFSPKDSNTTNWGSNPGTTVAGGTYPTAYKAGDDCSLTYSLVFDFGAAAVQTWVSPQLQFWSYANIDSGATVTVEYQDMAVPGTWNAFKPIGSANPWVASGPTVGSWNLVRVDLKTLVTAKTKIMIRFRLTATSAPVNPGFLGFAGWNVDEIAINDFNAGVVKLPFWEPFADMSNWIPSGNWKANTTNYRSNEQWDNNTASAGNTPAVPSSTSTLEYIQNFDFGAAAAPPVDPVVTFWNLWDVDAASFLKLEVSKDGGATWPVVWQLPSSSYYMTTEKAWERVSVDLGSTYGNTGKLVRLRFEFNTGATAGKNGWFIDDLSVVDRNANDGFDVTQGLQQTTALTSTASIVDPINGTSTSNWYAGGTWKITSEDSHGTGGVSWDDSPSLPYAVPESSVLEYKSAIDLTSGSLSQPTLYFWTKFSVRSSAGNHHLYVEEATDGGATDGGLFNYAGAPPAAPTWTQVWQNSPTEGDFNLGWHLVTVDLSAYKGQKIHLRFRLGTDYVSAADLGWYIDDFAILDRSQVQQLTLPYTEDASVSNFSTDYAANVSGGSTADFVTEDTWTLLKATGTYSAWQYYTGNTTPLSWVESAGWNTNYWHRDPSTDHTTWGAGSPNSVTINWPDLQAPAVTAAQTNDSRFSDLAMDDDGTPGSPNPFHQQTVFPAGVGWETLAPSVQNTEWWTMTSTRTLQASAAGLYYIRLQFTGGASIWHGGVPFGPADLVSSYPAGLTKAPDVVDPSQRSYVYQISMAAGQQIPITVRYYHTTQAMSGARMQLDVELAVKGNVVWSQPDTQPYYPPGIRTSLMLGKYFTIPAGQYATVTYSSKWGIGANDFVRAYYSKDGGLTWTSVVQIDGASTPNQPDWTPEVFQISNKTGASNLTQVTIKFELDARLSQSGGTGLFIDLVKISLSSTGLAPTNLSAIINTTVSTSVSNIVPSYSPAGSMTALNVTSQPTLAGTGNSVSVSSSTFSFKPRPGFIGTDSFGFSITNNSGTSGGSGQINVAAPTIGTTTTSVIQAEDYDYSPQGSPAGEGFTYHFTTTGTSPGYRADSKKNIEPTTDTGLGYDVGWTATGEWEKYTVNITKTGTYNITFRLASPVGVTGALHLELDGVNLTGSVNAPNTGGNQNWQDQTVANIPINVLGQHTLRLYWDSSAGNVNINYMKFVLTVAGAPTLTPTAGASPTPTTTPPPATGTGIRQQIYNNINSGSVASMTGNPRYNLDPNLSSPDFDQTLTGGFAAPLGQGGNAALGLTAGKWGQRLVGWLHVATAGKYYFYITSRNQSQLMLDETAGDRTFSNAQNIASSGGTNPGTSACLWQNGSEDSAGITLAAGDYLIWADMVRNNTNPAIDNLYVGWNTTGGNLAGGDCSKVIPQSVLAPY